MDMSERSQRGPFLAIASHNKPFCDMTRFSSNMQQLHQGFTSMVSLCSIRQSAAVLLRRAGQVLGAPAETSFWTTSEPTKKAASQAGSRKKSLGGGHCEAQGPKTQLRVETKNPCSPRCCARAKAAQSCSQHLNQASSTSQHFRAECRVGHAGIATFPTSVSRRSFDEISRNLGPSWGRTALNSWGRTAREKDTQSHRDVAGFKRTRSNHCVLNQEGIPLSQATKHQQSF